MAKSERAVPASGIGLLRLSLDAATSLGPGKANLLAVIAETGSIAAAGRRLKMSYKRAWSLVEEMNTSFREPLVLSSRGGQTGGGAELTPTGQDVLARYKSIEAATEAAIKSDVAALRALLPSKTV